MAAKESRVFNKFVGPTGARFKVIAASDGMKIDLEEIGR
jgi:hypothetical protein